MARVQARSGASRGEGLMMRLMALSVLVVALAGAAFSAQAHNHGRGGSPDMMMFGGSPERMGRMIDRLLDGVDATEAQRSQIKQIATAAATDLRSQREGARGLREQGLRIFTAPVVDAAAAESVRQQMAAQHEQAGKRTLQAMLDVAAVLTPEQRARLGERMAKRQAAMKERMQQRGAGSAPQR